MKNLVKSLCMIVAIAVLFTACKKKDDDIKLPKDQFPKNVTIEYRITPISFTGALDITFTNETGAITRLSNQALPFTKTIKKTVQYMDNFTLGISANVPGSAKLEILVDGIVVSAKSPTSQTYLEGSVGYTFTGL